MEFIRSLFGGLNTRFLNDARKIVTKINALEHEMEALTDADFPIRTLRFKERFAGGESLDSLLVEAFALVREASKRTMKMRHFDVQLIGGIALHRGAIAEMRTGEGKTLVATLPAYLNALAGKGVHIVTVNDYLAKRDGQWMGQLYSFLGLTTGIINDVFVSYAYDPNHQDEDAERDEKGDYKIFEAFLRPCSKQEAYNCDITYGTNSQFGFDYLRDNTVYDPSRLSQRGHFYAIVDEVDSILIDEARVPLILSTTANEASDVYRTFARLATMMVEGEDFIKDEKLHAIQLLPEGLTKAERQLGVANLYTPETMIYAHHLENAIRAKALYLRDREYLVRGGEVMIVDQFTGRVQEGRRWSDGLHQAIEAKEGVQIQQETRTLASITYQNYFKFYGKLSGMTGTAKTSSEEFFKVYGLEVYEIPTNRSIARIDNTDLIFVNEQAKFGAIAGKVKELNQKGQPVLIGTVSVENNEELSRYLTQQGITHVLLNAKNHESEGEVIAHGGKLGAVTVATNMAGRGIDIKLGGADATPEQADEVRRLGGLYVIGTERHEARRIDNQLRGRAGRQGDPGETQFYVSLDDHLMRVFGSDRVKRLLEAMKVPPDMPIRNSMISSNLEKAQERIEGFNFDSRKHTLSYDDVLGKHRVSIYGRRSKLLHRDTDYIVDYWNALLTPLSAPMRELLESKKQELGEKHFVDLFVRVSMSILDRLWMEHLELMDHSRRSVNLRAYGQREPLVEYAREALRLFGELETVFVNDLMHFFENVDVASLYQKPESETEVLADGSVVDVSVSEGDSSNGDGSLSPDSEYVIVAKGNETRQVKRKKLEGYTGTGWTIVQAGRR